MTVRFVTTGKGKHRKVHPLSTLKKRKSSSVQSLLVSKKGRSLTKAKQRAKELGFKTSKVDTSGNFFKFRQQDPKDVKVVGTIEFAPDVKARISIPKTRKKKDNSKGIRIPSILPKKKTPEEIKKESMKIVSQIKEDADVRDRLIQKEKSLKSTIDNTKDEDVLLGAKQQLAKEKEEIKKINSDIKNKLKKLDSEFIDKQKQTDEKLRDIIITVRAS